MKVSEKVINSSLACLNDFSNLFSKDPMINFAIPEEIGFGIGRGPACCLYPGEDILDYSGHLLNLTSRLNDLARPGGIVIDGSFLKSVIPENVRELFGEQEVYVRSIAEESPITVFFLKDNVVIPESALAPLNSENWTTQVVTFTVKQLLDNFLSDRFLWKIPAIKSPDKVKMTLRYNKRGPKGMYRQLHFTSFKYVEEGPDVNLSLDSAKMRAVLRAPSLKPNTRITVRISYVPKPLPRR